MALGVAAGAFGAHGLRARLGPDLLAIWETAARYHVYHALGLFAVDLIGLGGRSPRLLRAAGGLLTLGVALFSGSLYALALSGARWLGAITPLGGAAWIAAWCCLALAAGRASRRPAP